MGCTAFQEKVFRQFCIEGELLLNNFVPYILNFGTQRLLGACEVVKHLIAPIFQHTFEHGKWAAIAQSV